MLPDIFLCFFFAVFDLPDAVAGGCHGENIGGCHNEVEVVKVIDEPENDGDDHDPFEFDNVLKVNIPGKSRNRNDRDPGDGVHGNSTDGKNDLENDESDFKGSGSFYFGENNVSQNADSASNGSADSAENHMGDSLKGKLNTLGKHDFLFALNKTYKNHYYTSRKGDDIS